MTYNEAKAACEDLGYTNPRYIACYAELGRDPKPYEFMLWVQNKWSELAKQYSVTGSGDMAMKFGFEASQKMFDQFVGIP